MPKDSNLIIEENTYLKNLIQSIPGCVYWKNNLGVYLGCNQLFLKMAGLSSIEEVVGKTDKNLCWKDQAEMLRVHDMEVLLADKPIITKEVVDLATGEKFVYTVMKAPLKDGMNNTIGIIGTSLDITYRTKYESQLAIAKEKAEAASEAKNQFLLNMRHDIRTPLTGIVGFSEALKMDFPDPRIQEYADNLIASSNALQDFLDEILEAVRVSSGEIPLLRKKFNLAEVFEKIVALYSAKAKEKRLELTFKPAENLPRFVIGDKIRFHRIALELVGNALNFTDKGFVSIELTLAKRTKRNVVIKLKIIDSGIGIPKDKQQDIYLQFKRLTPSYQGIYKGAGLGLYVIKQFIDELEGEIYVNSEPGKGTCFTCLIPLQIPLVDDEEGVDSGEELMEKPYMSPLSHFSTPAPSLQPSIANILLVEDNPIAQKAAGVILRCLSCHVETAHNGEVAISLCEQKTYDLILMDIGLGEGLDGYEVTSFIRRQEKSSQVPIVALTAHAGDEQNRQRCIDAGMNAVLSKPLTKADATTLLKAFIPVKHLEPISPPLRRDLPDNDDEMFRLEHFPLFDVNDAIKNCVDEKLVIELLLLMLKELPNNVETMEKAFNEKDYPLVEKTAHKIKGGAAYVGTTRMKFACQYLERYWKAGEKKLFDTLYTQAMAVISETEQFIAEWLKNNS